MQSCILILLSLDPILWSGSMTHYFPLYFKYLLTYTCTTIVFTQVRASIIIIIPKGIQTGWLYVNQSALDHGSIMRTCIMWHARFRCNSTTKASTKSDRLQESAVDGETDTKLRIFLNLHYLLHIIDWNEIRKKKQPMGLVYFE